MKELFNRKIFEIIGNTGLVRSPDVYSPQKVALYNL